MTAPSEPMAPGRSTLLRPILIVEDNDMDLDLTLRAFRRRHIANPIDVARDGEEALAWVERWEAGAPAPALILLDLNLPKASGLDVLLQIKRHPVYSAIPIVVLTTSAVDKDIETAYRNGANSYIVKPVSFEKFIDVVDQINLYWSILNQPPEEFRYSL